MKATVLLEDSNPAPLYQYLPLDKQAERGVVKKLRNAEKQEFRNIAN